MWVCLQSFRVPARLPSLSVSCPLHYQLPQQLLPRAVKDTVVLTAPSTEARDKVDFVAQDSVPSVSTPLNVVVLERELSLHPDRNFVSNSINSLGYSTHVSYTGPHKPRVS